MWVRKIFKYELHLGTDTVIEITEGSKVLKCAIQGERICLWILVYDEHEFSVPRERRRFRIYGTGHPIVQDSEDMEYIDSVLVDGGSLVWHIFEMK